MVEEGINALLLRGGGVKLESHYNARLDYCNALSVKMAHIAVGMTSVHHGSVDCAFILAH